MGGNCCVAAREKRLPPSAGVEVSARRNIRYSPSWSFRWDNRTHIEDIIDVPSSQNNSGIICFDSKSGADTETEGFSDGSSPLDAFQTPRRPKSPSGSGISRSSRVAVGDKFFGSNYMPEEKDSVKSSVLASASDTKPSLSTPSTPSSSVSIADPSSSHSCSLRNDLSNSKKTRCSSRHQLTRQVSDSRIPSLKSLNENSSPDERQSIGLSACSTDLSAVGSHGGSSDGWSMRTFSELVASSQKERWSFGSESPCFLNSKFAKSNAQASSSCSADGQTCGVCSKLLKERSGALRLVSNELAVVAILVCGHVYHAECLEIVTPEGDKYDPSCPVCALGGKLPYKLLARFDSKAKNKISKIATDMDIDGGTVAEYQKRGKAPKLGVSSSMKSSFGRPFFRRHFQIGSSRPVRSVSESESSRKKGFWAKYRRD